MSDLASLTFSDADGSWKEQMASMWPNGSPKSFHLDDGFGIVAHVGPRLVGFISAYWQVLPEPLVAVQEAFIDFIEVAPDHRRMGVARRLINMAKERARQHGACQLRAWSSANKIEAIPMWNSLGFALCPADPRDEGGKGYYVAMRLDQTQPPRRGRRTVDRQ